MEKYEYLEVLIEIRAKKVKNKKGGGNIELIVTKENGQEIGNVVEDGIFLDREYPLLKVYLDKLGEGGWKLISILPYGDSRELYFIRSLPEIHMAK